MVQTSSRGTAFRPIKMVAAITRVRLDFDRLSPPAALVAVPRHAVDDVAKHLEELPENPSARRRPQPPDRVLLRHAACEIQRERGRYHVRVKRIARRRPFDRDMAAIARAKHRLDGWQLPI